MNPEPGEMQPETPPVGGPERGVAGQPGGRGPARTITIQKSIIIGGVVGLLAAAGSSFVTARVTDRQSHLDGLTSQVSEQEAQIAELVSQAADGADEVDRLKAQTATLEDQVRTLQSEKASLEEQLSEFLNPAPGPSPTAQLTAVWVQPYYLGSSGSAPTAVCVEIENTSAGDVTISYSYSQFSARDGDNFVYPPRLHTPGYSIQLHTPLMDGQLRPGEKRRGELLYDIPLPPDLTRLVWQAGFGETPEIAVDLPAAAETYTPNAAPC